MAQVETDNEASKQSNPQSEAKSGSASNSKNASAVLPPECDYPDMVITPANTAATSTEEAVNCAHEDRPAAKPAVWLEEEVSEEAGIVDPEMLEQVARNGDDGYVPLCLALYWLMTRQGVQAVPLDDEGGWARACEALVPLLGNEIELIGLPASGGLTERIPGHALGAITVVSPMVISFEYICLSGPTHIDCTLFLDGANWRAGLNDKLFIQGQVQAAWSQLQVRRRDLLARWPRPAPTIQSETDCRKWLVSEIRNSPGARPKSREAFWNEARAKFPRLAEKQFDRAWSHAIVEENAQAWRKPGPIPRSDHRGK